QCRRDVGEKHLSGARSPLIILEDCACVCLPNLTFSVRPEQPHQGQRIVASHCPITCHTASFFSSVGGPSPAATHSPCVGETDTHQPSDTNTSGSLHISTVRRRPRALPLPEFSGDSDVQQEGPCTPSAPDRHSQILEGRGQPAPRRSATESQQQPHE
ncbi:hypothetical protein NDU88_001408, partial [Pleurodeles waltl]